MCVQNNSHQNWKSVFLYIRNGNVEAASWQRASSFLANDSKFLGQTQHSCGSTDSLLSRYGSLRFLAVLPTWKRSWKGLDLCQETTLCGTRRLICTPFAKRLSRNAPNNGGTAGRSVFSHKKTTSKGIRVADFQACKCIFPGQSSDTFWTGLVHGSVHHESNLITVQQDATYSVYNISVGSSTCFGCWHPSSGARTTVITASGID